MNENDMNVQGIFENMDKVKALSKLMGASSGGSSEMPSPENIANAVSMAKKLGLFMNTGERNNSNFYEDNYKTENEIHEPTYESKGTLQILRMAIPFLDKEYQKNLFLAVKLFELNHDFDMNSMTLQSQSISGEPVKNRRENLLKAVRGQLKDSEKKQVDIVLKMIEAKRMASEMK